MGYRYDIFLSYKRAAETERWLDEHFLPLLEHHLELELGRRPTIFRDVTNIDAGTSWPLELAEALRRARVLVPLWTKTYFHSEWCSRELATMLARETTCELRTPGQPRGLVVPVVLHDCEALPDRLGQIQAVRLHKTFNSRMQPNSVLAEMLATRLGELAPGLATAIDSAPAWREDWTGQDPARLLPEFFKAEPALQRALPTL